MYLFIKYIEFRKAIAGLLMAAGMAAFFYILPVLCEYAETIQSNASNASDAQPGWTAIESGYFTIYTSPDAGLRRIDKRITKRAFYFGQETMSGGNPIGEKIAYRMDYLFKRACDMLGIYPKGKKIKIKIAGSRDELQKIYSGIFGKEADDIKSFYIHKHCCIYTSEEDITDSVLVHEMAHAIIDNYFAVVPPPEMGEILASYVDMHLDD